ncbi:MAG: lysylphosphatidylglycerol synthase domain-containing protein [Bacteroidales bacterium]
MKLFFRKYGYKIIAWLVFALSILYFYRRFLEVRNSFDYKSVLISLDYASIYTLIGVFLMLFANWGIEALKWQWVNKPFEKISFTRSLKSVFMGVAVSTIFPNRTGEFLGKILVLKKENRVKGVLSSVLTSLSQLSITLLVGLWALFAMKISFRISETYVLILTIITILILLFFKRIISFLKKFLSLKWINFIDFIRFYSFNDIFVVLLLSAIRYGVFTTQLFLLILVFGGHISFVNFFPLSAIAFTLTTVIPTTSLSELLVRSNVGLVVFAPYKVPDNTIVLAYFCLWMINILLPSLIGFYFGLKKKWV